MPKYHTVSQPVNRQCNTKYDVTFVFKPSYFFFASHDDGLLHLYRQSSMPLNTHLASLTLTHSFSFVCVHPFLLSFVGRIGDFDDDDADDVMSERETHSKWFTIQMGFGAQKSYSSTEDFSNTNNSNKIVTLFAFTLRACDFSECLCSQFCLPWLMLHFFQPISAPYIFTHQNCIQHIKLQVGNRYRCACMWVCCFFLNCRVFASLIPFLSLRNV